MYQTACKVSYFFFVYTIHIKRFDKTYLLRLTVFHSATFSCLLSLFTQINNNFACTMTNIKYKIFKDKPLADIICLTSAEVCMCVLSFVT